MSQRQIAIVSIAGRFPGAPSVEALWTLVSERRSAVRDVPQDRWPAPIDQLVSSRGGVDTARSRRACLLEPFELSGDVVVPPDAGRLSALTKLTLQVGTDALRGVKVNRERTAVIVANIALPTDASSQLSEQVLLGAIRAQLEGKSFSPDVEPLDAFPSAVPVGLLARSLGLSGGSWTLDAACASSLYALHLGCIELEAGRADAVLAGGVSLPQSLYTQVGFTQLQALSPSGVCAPFGVNADGLVVGEGAGMVVLKRLEDAERDGDRILGVIRGIGVSNDVGGSLLSPEAEGQLRAMRSAYAQAGWSPEDVQLVECHGTGTPRGDQVELESLAALRGGARSPCVIGSVKSNVGHLLTAAGMAGLAKVLQAIARRQLPPSANVTATVPAAQRGGLELLAAPRAWDGRRRAAISGFGFGGINAHVLVEEYEQATPRAQVTAREHEPIAIVGMGAHVGALASLDALRLAIARGEGALTARPAERWRGLELEELRGLSLGGWIEALEIPVGKFKLPPLEVPAVLPQQLLMLEVAAAAIEDAGGLGAGPHPRVGALIGLGLDLETTSFQLRWVLRERARALGLPLDEAWLTQVADALSAPLDAQRTLGALGGIVASRVARELSLGGPSFGVQAEETAGLRALEIATRLLQRGEVDQMLVGAVDLACDVRRVLAADRLARFSRGKSPRPFDPGSPGAVPGEGATAVVLKRLSDAQRDGNRIYAVVRGLGGASGERRLELALQRAWEDAGAAPTSARLVEAHATGRPAADLGELEITRSFFGDAAEVSSTATLTGALGAAAGLTSLVKAALCLHHELLPPLPGLSKEGRAWARNRIEGPRRAGVSSLGLDGSAMHVVLEQAPESTRRVTSALAGARPAGLFLVGDDARALLELCRGDEPVDRLAARWHRAGASSPVRRAIVATSVEDLRRQLTTARPAQARVEGKVAFVFPGSGTHFDGMGRSLHVALPETLARLDRDSESLALHLAPPVREGIADIIVRHVTHGLSVAEGLGLLGVTPHAYIGYSLGESAGLFSSRAWRERDVMFRRTLESPLFRTQLGGACTVMKDVWGADAEWSVALVMRPREEVCSALVGTTALLIVNAPRECVIGGRREHVRETLAKLGGEGVFLEGVPFVHLPAMSAVKAEYRALHVLKATPPAGVSFYSAAWARPYEVTTDAAADSVTDDALHGFDFTKVIERAWADGVRIFVEAGPQGSCTRMIGRILEGKPHLALSACQRGQDGYVALLQAVAKLAEAGVPVSLDALYEDLPLPAAKPTRSIVVPLGKRPPLPSLPAKTMTVVLPPAPSVSSGGLAVTPGAHPMVLAAMKSVADAHEAFLRASEQSTALQLKLLEAQAALLRGATPVELPPPAPQARPARFDRAQCLEFAIGSLGKMLGPKFAIVDSYPTRVRLPDEPLMLVDRIVEVEGEPASMTSGRCVTEHDVHAGAWYLDGGRVPVCISVEAGQADLFLSGYLGVDLQTKGERVYRLLDAKVQFHRDLPRVGEIIRYDIRIDRFIRQGDTWLFFFRFDGTIDGQPFITMFDGCAGFFSVEQLEAGKGIVAEGRKHVRKPRATVAPFSPILPAVKTSLDERQVEALRSGALHTAFGPDFPLERLAPALRLPSGRMRLVDRILELDTAGGAAGLGLVIGEHDVTPDAWYLTCHFKDDPVMPGTLMYECCLHTLRVLLLRLGWVDDASDVDLHYAPVEGVVSPLKCRGQVIPTTKKVQYRVEIDQIGYDPEPFVIATASMFADGKHVVQMDEMSVRIRGLTKERVERLRATTPRRAPEVRFTREQILEYCEGAPSRCFGPQYAVFGEQRRLARLPRPPYLFMDRVLHCEPKPFELKPGGWITCEYDVPRDAWYFGANRQRAMPFAVLLEAALQPCGFLAAYAGSALDSAEDLKFRNLDGRATIHREVFSDAGTLTLRSRMTKVSRAGGMILESFDFEVLSARGEPVYTGSTGFGFFPKAALEQQVGLRGAQPFVAPSGRSFALPLDAPLTPDDAGGFSGTGLLPPAKAFAMVDRVDVLSLEGGAHGLGFVSGSKQVNPDEWFFRAHFFQDPVMPGSLGLEALVQLLGAWARERFPALMQTHRFQSLAVGAEHVWQYRGQVVPTNAKVTVEAAISRVLDGDEPLIVADGQLTVDGKIIYAMKDFPLRLVKESR
ncbi:MAG: beta-ketoacyl synthase N-terminal-like domain-containing protein [Myxococcota bacterium]